MKTEVTQFVLGWCSQFSGMVVRKSDAPMGREGTHLNFAVDMSQQITLKRCAEIMQEARLMSGRDLHKIEIKDSEYTKTPGNECSDFAETCIRDKSYVYESRSNTLTISDRGRIVYINDNGDILHGDDAHVAHTDSLDV